MKFSKTGLIYCMLTFLNMGAQNYEMGKVSIEELNAKQHATDTSAAAAILFKKGETTFDYDERDGFVMSTRVRTRIKIYKKEGYGWGNHAVAYYVPNNSKESVTFKNAVTYNLVNGKIVRSKLNDDGEFNEVVNKYWGRKKIAMPNVREGSVIEYEYTINSPNLAMLKDWDFQTDIPVNYSEYSTLIPEYFMYKANFKGFLLPKMTKESQQKSFVMNSKQRSVGRSNQHTTFAQDKIDYQASKVTYRLENLPAMKDEAFVNNIANYTASVAHELTMIQYPNSVPKMFSADWESVTKSIYDDPDFGEELNKTGYFEDDITAIIQGKSNENDKINAIFDYVKSKVTWNGFNSYSCDGGVRKAYKEGTGNVAEINLMLVAMLRFAGINANPVLISTRANGISYFPTRTAFNYVIAAVEKKEGVVLLDATEKFSAPDVLPLRDLNWFGRLLRKDKTSSEINLMPVQPSRELMTMQYVVDDKGVINGKVRRQITNNIALGFRQDHVATSAEVYLEMLENKNDKIEITDYARENERDPSKPVVEMYSFVQNAGIDIVGDKMYLTPLLFNAQSENPFKQEVREYPVDFGYPAEYRYNVSIEIPEGYSVESVPESANFVMENKLSSFKYAIGSSAKQIQISATVSIYAAIISADYYVVLKDLFQRMVDKQKEKIVLKKV